MDTIYALATASGRAGVAVIRVSGPHAPAAVLALCGDVPPARRASLRAVRDAAGGLIDRALVLTFPEGASFTGEAAAEFQTHGSRAIVAALLRRLSELDGLRQAEPGEFTRRALENGRMDLTEVEGLADLIDAETEAQRRQALRVFSGELGRKTEIWRSALVRAMALIEVTIDFADEEVPTDVGPEVQALLANVQAGMTAELAGAAAAERVRDGFEVAIVGPPNIGKSTLLNRIAGRDAAITSNVAGTTRDVIEVRIEINGLAVTLLDTAGLRNTTDEVEKLGIDLARRRAGTADLRVVLCDGGPPSDLVLEPDDIVLLAKGDLGPRQGPSVSGKTGAGVSDLLDRIGAILAERVGGAGLVVHERHRRALTDGVAAVSAARAAVALGPEHAEMAAEELRAAVRILDSLIGRVDVEDVLDRIFSSFCLGK